MRRALSTRVFADQRLSAGLLESVRKAGFDGVELFCNRAHLDYRGRSQVDELRRYFADSELRPDSIRAPLSTDESSFVGSFDSAIDLTTPEKRKRIAATDEVKRALELADVIPARFFILRLGLPDQERDEDRFESAFNALDELNLFARQLDVELLLENLLNGLSTSERLDRFLRATHLPLGCCFDVGWAALAGGVRQEFEAIKDRARAARLKEIGDRRAPRLPAPGSEDGAIDWRETMGLLESLGPDAPLILEGSHETAAEDRAAEAFEVFKRLEDL